MCTTAAAKSSPITLHTLYARREPTTDAFVHSIGVKGKTPVRECGIIFDSGYGGQLKDETGCKLRHGNDGPHEFSEPSGKVWQWETDWECKCEHCQECEGDYFFVYWPKKSGSE